MPRALYSFQSDESGWHWPGVLFDSPVYESTVTFPPRQAALVRRALRIAFVRGIPLRLAGVVTLRKLLFTPVKKRTVNCKRRGTHHESDCHDIAAHGSPFGRMADLDAPKKMLVHTIRAESKRPLGISTPGLHLHRL